MDVFTRLIRGWELGRSLDQSLTRIALERGLAQHRPEVHHSDQGVQYAATDYAARLQALSVQISMATAGKPEENPYAERLIRTIKDEEVYLSDYQDFTDAHTCTCSAGASVSSWATFWMMSTIASGSTRRWAI